MQRLAFKKLQFAGLTLMASALFAAGTVQGLLLMIGSLMVLAGLSGRMYLIHFLFRLPVSNTVLRYLLIPMSAFLIMNALLGVQPSGIPPGMWYYLLIWTSAVMGMWTFIFSFTRRLLALPWPVEKQK